MSDVLEFLLGVDRIDLSKGGPIEFRFLSPWPAWVAFLAALAAVVYIWHIYRRENPGAPAGARVFLMVLRCLVVLLGLTLLFEPALVLVRNDTIKSAVAVLVDRSASMTVADGRDSDPGEEAVRELLARGQVEPSDPARPTRYDVVRAALAADDAAALEALAAKQKVYLYAFGESPELVARIDTDEAPNAVAAALQALAAEPPDEPRSAPIRSMEMVFEELAGETLTAAVLLSDGKSTAPTPADRLKEMAEARGVPLFTVGVGSTRRPNDLELRNVAAKRWSFISEKPLIRATVVNQGLQGQAAELQLRVKGHPELDQTRTVDLGPAGLPQVVELRFEPEVAGTYEVTVSLKPLVGEFDEENNTNLPLKIDVIDSKPKVLVVEDLPRWEYQYLKNALFRDPTVQVSVLLLSADLLFAPEGDLPIRSFPATREELFAYDVIIIGDVDRRVFSNEQLEWIEEFVREMGKGVIFIAGQRLLDPNTYAGSPLETLLPIVPSDEQLVGAVTDGWRPEMTIEGSVSPALKFEQELEANNEAWANLPPLYWYYQARRAKEGAEVLLVHPTAHNPAAADGKFPIMVLQRVGSGRVFFSATDETWRWRWYTGRRYFNTFWLQIVRTMALPQEELSIETGRLRYALGDQAKIKVRFADRQSVPDTQEEIKATVLFDVPEENRQDSDELVLQRTRPETAVFEAEFTPERPGKYKVVCETVTARGKTVAESEFVVAASREEFLDPVRDQALLESMAALGKEGRALDVAQVASLGDLIVSRSRMVRNDLTDEIWDSPLALGLFVLLIGTEWILRKRYRML